MTPAQLIHLAEQAEFAAGFFAVTNPAAARRFSEAATTALQLSANLDRQQQLVRLRAELADIRRRIDRRAKSSEFVPTGVAEVDASTVAVAHDL